MMQEKYERDIKTYLYEPSTHIPLASVCQSKSKSNLYEKENISSKHQELKFVYHHSDLSGILEETSVSFENEIRYEKYATWGLKIRNDTENRDNQNIRLQGQYFDYETNLHYNMHRYYDPEIGRFLTNDPIGLLGGQNLYLYAFNPLTWVDPLGLSNERFPTWMATKQGYQRQHIIPYSLKEHEFMVRSGMDINSSSNMMHLPVAKGIDANDQLGLHRGWTKEHAEYNRQIKFELDGLEHRAILEKWDYRRVQSEVLNLQHEKRRGFKTGRITCA